MSKKFSLTEILEKVPKSSGESETSEAVEVVSSGHKLKDTTRLKDARIIPLHKIKPDPNQPRRQLSKSELHELADSIREHGVIEPITVRYLPEKEHFQIIAGERRYRASKLAGKADIPCLIREAEPANILALQLVENIQRENLNPMEKAQGLVALKELLGPGTIWQQVEAKTGISPAHRKKLVSYLKLPENVQRFATNENHARALLQVIGRPEQMAQVIADIKAGTSGKQTLKKTNLKKNSQRKTDEQTPTKRRQRLVILYHDEQDLLRQLQAKIKQLKKDLSTPLTAKVTRVTPQEDAK